MAEHSKLPLRIRRHPLSQPSAEVVQLVEQHRLRWDNASSLGESLSGCRA
jgi:hypothetical protein